MQTLVSAHVEIADDGLMARPSFRVSPALALYLAQGGAYRFRARPIAAVDFGAPGRIPLAQCVRARARATSPVGARDCIRLCETVCDRFENGRGTFANIRRLWQR
jgi:hypothetical protein